MHHTTLFTIISDAKKYVEQKIQQLKKQHKNIQRAIF